MVEWGIGRTDDNSASSATKQIPLFNLIAINRKSKDAFAEINRRPIRVSYQYPNAYYEPGYNASRINIHAFHEIDFIKYKLEVEV